MDNSTARPGHLGTSLVNQMSLRGIPELVINQRLRGALLNAGMTVNALADAVQVDPKTVSRWLAEDGSLIR